MSNWKIYPRGAGATAITQWLQNPPPWRRLDTVDEIDRPVVLSPAARQRGETYVPSGPEEELRVNMALLLRRPLLVSGPPGIGKSSLAYHVALCLELGTPLRWEINSRTTLESGLYTYDAVAHLRATQERRHGEQLDAGEFITLGPLGTALLPTKRPRVLLVDELDKASYDLPNDLLHVFEEGAFTIPELVRQRGSSRVTPAPPLEPGERIELTEGTIRTRHHPVVVITSNAEREFPPAFRRRCVELELARPRDELLREIVRRQLGNLPEEMVQAALLRHASHATDVVLQALFLETRFGAEGDAVGRGLARD